MSIQDSSVTPDAQARVGWEGWMQAVSGCSEESDEWGVSFHSFRYGRAEDALAAVGLRE